MTDHKGISIKINMVQEESVKKHGSYWKLNNKLLENECLKEKIKGIIEKYRTIAELEKLYGKYWELMKFDIRKAFINQGKLETKNNNIKEKSIIEDIFNLCKKKKESLTDCEFQKLDLLQIELDKIYEDKARGAFIRTRLKWLEKGEKKIQNTFLALKKRNNDFASISKLMINNKLVDNSSVISKYVAQFFSNLYSPISATYNMDTFLNSLVSDTKKIDQNFRNICDKEINIEELRECINFLKNNKSPGNDGLTSEFYKTFSKELSPFLLLVFVEAIQNGELPVSLKQGIITLIPKPKKDKLFIENWRPISLLNNDSKLFAMIFARRLKQGLDKIIDIEQSGCKDD